MKTLKMLTIAAVGLLSAAPALAQMHDMNGMNMQDMHGMDMHGMKMKPGEKRGSGTGVVTAIDAKAGTVTIKHGPIAAVGWPAMTMTFHANPASLLKGIHVMEKVAFDMRTRGSTAEVTAIRAE